MDQDERNAAPPRPPSNIFRTVGAGCRHRLDGQSPDRPAARRPAKTGSVVSSSSESTKRLEEQGLDVSTLNSVGDIDLYIDGADEATKHRALIKGGGGALTREKVLAGAARKFVCIIDDASSSACWAIPAADRSIANGTGIRRRKLVKMRGQPIWRENFRHRQRQPHSRRPQPAASPTRSNWKPHQPDSGSPHRWHFFAPTGRRTADRGRWRRQDYGELGQVGPDSANNQKRPAKAGLFVIGWGTRIRTWVDGVRVRSPTARRSPNAVRATAARSHRRSPLDLSASSTASRGGLSQTDFLALDFTRVARYEAGFAQAGAGSRRIASARGQTVANRAGLAGRAATGDRDVTSNCPSGSSARAAGARSCARSCARKTVQRAIVDGNLAAPGRR